MYAIYMCCHLLSKTYALCYKNNWMITFGSVLLILQPLSTRIYYIEEKSILNGGCMNKLLRVALNALFGHDK